MTKVVADHRFEFSGYKVRPKNYENGHKNIFGLSVVLESKVEKQQNPEYVFKVDYFDFPCEIFEILGELDVRVVACIF